MGGFISQAILVTAAILLREHSILFWICVVLNGAHLWAWGVMHNFATENAKRRRAILIENMRHEGRANEANKLSGQPIHITPQDALLVPDALSTATMLLTIAGIVMIVVSFFVS